MQLTKRQLEGLKQYKYSGVDKSFLSKTVLTPYWNNLVKLFPMTMAPNTITFLGLCFVFSNVLTLLVLDPSYSGNPLPSWVYASWAVGLFAYQSMDAIDGKQARRTGMSGPLGEMFDHGCDAINTSLEVMLSQAAFGMTRSWWTVASQAATVGNFYLSTWEEYHTGTLFLSAFSGPVEGILLICGIYALTAAFGPSLWAVPIIDLVPWFARRVDVRAKAFGGQDRSHMLSFVELGDQAHRFLSGFEILAGKPGVSEPIRIRDSFMYFATIGLVFNVASSYYNVIQSRRQKKLPVVQPLVGLLPFVAHTLMLVFWLAGGKFDIVHSSMLLPFIGYWGSTFSYQVSHLILAHVTKSSFPYWNGMMLWTFFGMVDANAQRLFGRQPWIQSTQYRTNVFLYVSFAIALLNYIRFARSVIWQITEYTGIACFTVRHKDQSGHWIENEQAADSKKSQ